MKLNLDFVDISKNIWLCAYNGTINFKSNIKVKIVFLTLDRTDF